MENEVWKDIPDYKGLYQVSNYGRIKSLFYQNNVVNKKYYREKILKQKTNKDNSMRVELYKNKKHKTFLVHRLVAFTFYNEDINNHNLTVNHIDGNRLNNKIENLELISLADNIRHGFNTGLYHTQKPIKLTNKNNNYDKVFRSMSEASIIMNKNKGYISQKIRKGIFEDKNFKWKLY